MLAFPARADTSFGFLPERQYDGRTYTARPSGEVTTVLLIGYDHNSGGQQTELHGYSNGGQADFLLLVVLDHRYDRIQMLQIDRDTITQVRVTDSAGHQHDRSNLQICLAHAYGNTREANNANTILAVETLLGIAAPDDGVAIDWYVAMDISGISRLNDLMGGVTVEIREDLTQIDPAMKAGTTLTLTGEQAEKFCRARMGLDDATNASRMKRQQQYMKAAAVQLVKMLRKDSDFGMKLLIGMGVIYSLSAPQTGGYSFGSGHAGTPTGSVDGHWLMTSAQSRTIVSALSRSVNYKLMDVETLPGKHSVGTNGYVRYDLENDAGVRWALSTLYRTEE